MVSNELPDDLFIPEAYGDMSQFGFAELSEAAERLLDGLGITQTVLTGSDFRVFPCTGERLFAIVSQHEHLFGLSAFEEDIVLTLECREIVSFGDIKAMTYHNVAACLFDNIAFKFSHEFATEIHFGMRWRDIDAATQATIAEMELEYNGSDTHLLAFQLRAERAIYLKRKGNDTETPAGLTPKQIAKRYCVSESRAGGAMREAGIAPIGKSIRQNVYQEEQVREVARRLSWELRTR